MFHTLLKILLTYHQVGAEVCEALLEEPREQPQLDPRTLGQARQPTPKKDYYDRLRQR